MEVTVRQPHFSRDSMKLQTLYLCLVIVLVASYAEGYRVQDHGSETHAQDEVKAYFTTNLEEMQDAPLTFDFPPPAWLKGTLIRNGLGRFEVGHRKFMNALDAYGKLSSWKFPGNGTASFTTKMIYTDSYRDALKINDVAPYMFLDKVSPSFNVMQEMQCIRNGLDNTNVNIVNFGKDKVDFVVTSDIWKIYTVDPYTLETLKPYNPTIPDASHAIYPVSLSSAHPLPEYGTSNHLTFNSLAPIMPGVKSKIVLVRAKTAGEREVIATIEVDKISYMHSFAATENYMILFAVPFYVDPLAVMKNFMPLGAFQWDSSDVTKLYVVNLKTKEVKTLQTENMFFLHTVNAYESNIFGNEIIVDVCAYKNTSGLFEFDFDNLNNPDKRAAASHASLKRYTINLQSGDVSVRVFEVTSNISYVNRFDFPTINENFRYKKYCYIYGVVNNYDDRDFLHTALVKKDVCTGKNEHSWTSAGKLINEAVFIPRPGSLVEDDGVLVTPILDSFSNSSTINVYDARDLTLLSSALLPTSLPFGTHGRFFDFIV